MNRRIEPQYICSIAGMRDAPEPSGEEYCVLGRSNVGKSSFISHVLARRGLAKASKSPGKTRTANFYRVDSGTVWVDMPGYGHAKVSLREKDTWSRLISDYCKKRKNLRGAIWLVDARHPGQESDMKACEWLNGIGLPFFPVATKSDKLSTGRLAQNLALMSGIFGLEERPLHYSILSAQSREAFWEFFNRWRAG